MSFFTSISDSERRTKIAFKLGIREVNSRRVPEESTYEYLESLNISNKESSYNSAPLRGYYLRYPAVKKNFGMAPPIRQRARTKIAFNRGVRGVNSRRVPEESIYEYLESLSIINKESSYNSAPLRGYYFSDFYDFVY